MTAHRATRRIGRELHRLIAMVLAVILVAAACGDDDEQPTDDPDPQPPQAVAPAPPPVEDEEGGLTEVDGTDHDFNPGQFAEIHLSPIATVSEIEEVEAVIEAVLTGSEFIAFVDRIEPYVKATFEENLFDAYPELLPCFRYGAASVFVVQLEQPDPSVLQAVADALRGHPAVLSVESFGLDLGFSPVPAESARDEEGREISYDEYLAERCFGFELTVDLDSSVGADERDRLAAELLALDAVGAVMVDRDSFEGEGDFFRPDLSGYPAMAACEGTGVSSIRVILPAGNQAATDQVVDAIGDDPRVVGFFGAYIDDARDDFDEFDEALFTLCERMTVYVDLLIDISDSDAALVVSRALGVPGVADVELRLFDPEQPEGCEPGFGEDDTEALTPGAAGGSLGVVAIGGEAWLAAFSEVIDECFVPTTSSLTIYRGDPDAASQRLLAEALCGLPGVISLASFDSEIMDSDPYLDCEPLHLQIRMDAAASDADRRALLDALESNGSVLSVDAFFGFTEDEWAPRVPEVVVGDIDPYRCDPELAWEAGNLISVRLGRLDETQVTALAGQIASMTGVADLSGNAVRSADGIEAECGHDLIWFWLSPDATDEQRNAVYAVLAGRDDVVAVVVIDEGENSHVHDGDEVASTRWVGVVKFAANEEPADIEQLVADLDSMPGVVTAERILHEDDFFDCGEAEGYICEEDFTDVGDVEP